MLPEVARGAEPPARTVMVEDEWEEEWDYDFVEKAVQAEEQAQLSLHQPPPTQHSPPPPLPLPPRVAPCEVSYSPPRELSQRTRETNGKDGAPDPSTSSCTVENDFAREQENDRLKRELHGVSKHLRQLEEEILEIRKERDIKEQQLKVLQSKIETKDAEFQNTKNVEIPAAPAEVSTPYQDASTSNNQLGSSGIHSSEKLCRLWNSDDQKQGRVLVAKLFMTCEADFSVLFGYLNTPQKDKGTQSIETAKVSQLYSVLNKNLVNIYSSFKLQLQISNDILRLGDLLGALGDLCSLKNVVVVRSSIRILHNVLIDSLILEKEFDKRENVIVEEHSSEDINSRTNGSGDPKNESLRFTNVAEMLKQGQKFAGLELSISVAFWVSLFETVCLVSVENNEIQIRLEAVSIMILILMRQNAYSDRDKFARELVFRSLSQLLKREAGFSVQDRAVHSLYLLCNCPKVIPMLCSGFEVDGERACSKDIIENTSTFNGLNEILNGLADCVACYGSSSAQEMKLRKNAITLLAFVGSTAQHGFEILLKHKLPKGTNFLAIILQSLASDLDPRALNSAKQSDIVRELCLLTREALIFLNRLVSHPDYSVPVLQALTNTREMASTTVDVANRLTQNSNSLWKDISSKKHVRESEIMDLARVFKKRVFTFLGDSIS
ncbi:hypothetical protein CASFOL_020342 [Castilleja foliolosa]|uniref:Uncharacterized protein n=1 Tax=Castilleja foliolosa TaxID=1961234 RepID=A0ABD3D0K1_9LAMI